MKLSTITLFKNTPFTNVQNTFLFENFAKRDEYFNLYQNDSKDKLEFGQLFNFRREVPTLKIPTKLIKYPENLEGYNYCEIVNGFDNKKYYFFITNYIYLNDNVIELSLTLDVMTTFVTKEKLESLKRVHLIRQSFKTYSKRYIADMQLFDYPKKSFMEMTLLYGDMATWDVLLFSNVDLSKDFGTDEAPKVETSTGASISGIKSPTDIYYFKTASDFRNFMSKMQKFPWIVQNFTKAVMVPAFMTEKFTKTTFNNAKLNLKLSKVNGTSGNFHKEIQITIRQLMDNVKDYLINNSIFNIKITDYLSGEFDIDLNMVDITTTKPLKINIDGISGYTNQLYITVDGYKGNGANYILDSLTVTEFDELPIQLNQGNLSQAKGAYQRELQKSRTVSGRINNIQNGNTKDKVFNALSLISSFSSNLTGTATNIAGLYNNEYELSRDLETQRKSDMLQGQSVSSMSTNNAFLGIQKKAGIHAIAYKVDDEVIEKAIKFVDNYGVQIDEYNRKIELKDFNSMDRIWLQCDTIEWFEGLNPTYANAINAILSGGVRFYRYKGVKKW